MDNDKTCQECGLDIATCTLVDRTGGDGADIGERRYLCSECLEEEMDCYEIVKSETIH